MDKPLFSVVITAYNQEEYIVQALDSIIDQKHNYPYEIIAADDFSTDNTRQVLLEYKEKYPDIIKLLLNETNIGLIENYFNALGYCSGKYIMQLADDDYWLPGTVTLQIPFMEEHPDVGMCYGRMQYWYEEEKKFGEIAGSETVTVSELMKSNDIPANAICIRNELVKNYIQEINPVEKKWYCEDYPMWFWVAYNSKIHFMDTLIAIYRIRKESIAHTQNKEKELMIYSHLIDIRKFYSNLYNIQLFIDDIKLITKKIIKTKKCLSYKEYLQYRELLLLSEKKWYIRSIIKTLLNKSYFNFKLFSFIKRKK